MLTKESLLGAFPAAWQFEAFQSPYYTVDKLKAIVSFRAERMGEVYEWESAVSLIENERLTRKAAKELKRLGR